MIQVKRGTLAVMLVIAALIAIDSREDEAVLLDGARLDGPRGAREQDRGERDGCISQQLAARSFSAASLRSRLRKPGPAISTVSMNMLAVQKKPRSYFTRKSRVNFRSCTVTGSSRSVTTVTRRPSRPSQYSSPIFSSSCPLSPSTARRRMASATANCPLSKNDDPSHATPTMHRIAVTPLRIIAPGRVYRRGALMPLRIAASHDLLFGALREQLMRQGNLLLEVPLADSITTWRLTALASSQDGRLGSLTAPLRVFQDFFIDLDLPVALTVGERSPGEEFRHPDHAVHRRADFMAHIGEKL